MIFIFLNVPGQNKGNFICCISSFKNVYNWINYPENFSFSQIKIGILESEICFPVFLKQY